VVQQIPAGEHASLPDLEDNGVVEIATGVAYSRLGIANVVYIGAPDAGDGRWVLVDAGVWGTTSAIVRASETRFGNDSRPAAIVLTHGHFDHVGALQDFG